MVKEIKHNARTINNTTIVQMLVDKYNGQQNLSVIAVDDEGFSNTTIIKVNVTEDTNAPYLDTNSVSINKLASGQYKVTLKFLDDSSTVNGWSLKFAENPSRQDKFSQNSATFTVNTLNPVGYVVKDKYNNSKIDVVYLKQYFDETSEDIDEESQLQEMEDSLDEILDVLNNL